MIDRELAEALVDLIETESRLEESQFVGATLSDTPISLEQVERADKIFRGVIALENGGTPCISCHSTGRLKGLGGGQIGPDLTKAYERLGGRQSLASFLLAPTSPTMTSQFSKRPFVSEEVQDLSAYLEDIAKSDQEKEPSQATASFLLLGLILTCLVLFGIGAISRNQVWNRNRRHLRPVKEGE
jgi:hypothetical protein